MFCPKRIAGAAWCFALALFVASFAVAWQSNDAPPENHIVPGARVFIEKMNGFDDDLTAALHAKQVPLVVVTDEDKADFRITGFGSSRDLHHHTRATIKVVDKDGTVVFAYSYEKDYAAHGRQSAAEACAKKLKNEILSH